MQAVSAGIGWTRPTSSRQSCRSLRLAVLTPSVRYPAEPANPNHGEHHGVAEAGEERTPELIAGRIRAHGGRQQCLEAAARGPAGRQLHRRAEPIRTAEEAEADQGHVNEAA